MAELWTGTGQVPTDVQGWFDQALQDFLPADFVYLGHGERRNIPANAGTILNLSRPNLLAAATTAVEEYATPPGAQFSTTDMHVHMAWYGNHVPFSSRAMQVGLIKNLLGVIKDVLTVNKADSFDQIGRDVLVAGSQVHLANGTVRTDVNTVIKAYDIDRAINLLVRANVKPLTKRIEPSTGVGTAASNPAFIGICHWDLYQDLKGLSGWLDAANYPAGTTRLPNEVGRYRGARDVRVICSSNGKIWAGGGASGGSNVRATSSVADVYALIIFGEKYYIESTINGKTNGVVVQPLGSSGSADPFKQRGTIGWYDPFVVARGDEARCVRIECAVTDLAVTTLGDA